MKKSLFRKLKNNKSGFSIAEALIAVLILLMVSSVVAGGMPVAAKAYRDVVDSANAQILLSTTVTALRDELGTASFEATTPVSGSKINYTSTVGGASEIEFTTSNGVYIKAANVNNNVARLLVSDEASAGMVVSIGDGGSIIYTNGVITITTINVTRKDKPGEVLASLSELDIKVIGK